MKGVRLVWHALQAHSALRWVLLQTQRVRNAQVESSAPLLEPHQALHAENVLLDSIRKKRDRLYVSHALQGDTSRIADQHSVLHALLEHTATSLGQLPTLHVNSVLLVTSSLMKEQARVLHALLGHTALS